MHCGGLQVIETDGCPIRAIADTGTLIWPEAGNGKRTRRPVHVSACPGIAVHLVILPAMTHLFAGASVAIESGPICRLPLLHE
jgi:hypothetical protein